MTLVVIDTETGGLDDAVHPLLSVSLVELDADLQPKRSLDLFVEPKLGERIEPEAAKVNGYTPELWKQRGARPLREVMTEVAKWCPRFADPLAHNAPFDKGFMETAFARSGIRQPYGYRWRCSMATMMAADDAFAFGFPNYQLATLAGACGHWGPGHQRGAHQAKDDALACAAGYRWLLERMRAGKLSVKVAGAG